VVTQETGFSKFLPSGEGLLPFLTEEDAKQALETIVGDYDRHSAAALIIAREYFDADDVLRRMMATLGLL
jgi:O-methyltransferase involved in polyketide biosynthesis